MSLAGTVPVKRLPSEGGPDVALAPLDRNEPTDCGSQDELPPLDFAAGAAAWEGGAPASNHLSNSSPVDCAIAQSKRQGGGAGGFRPSTPLTLCLPGGLNNSRVPP